MTELASRAKDAVAAGAPAVRTFVADAMTKDAAALVAYLEREAPLHVLVAVGAELKSGGRSALLDAPHQLLVEEYVWLRDWQAPPAPPHHKPTDADVPHLDDDFHEAHGVPRDVVVAATRIAISTARAGDHGTAHRELLAYHVRQAGAQPDLDGAIARLLAAGLLGELPGERLAGAFGRRLVPLVAAALELPSCDPAVRKLAHELRRRPALPDSDNRALAAALRAWWASEGPYLYVNVDAINPTSRSGVEPAIDPSWLVADDWAMFEGQAWRRVPSDSYSHHEPPAAWTALPADRRAALARESQKRRRDEPASWQAWFAARRAEIGIAP